MRMTQITRILNKDSCHLCHSRHLRHPCHSRHPRLKVNINLKVNIKGLSAIPFFFHLKTGARLDPFFRFDFSIPVQVGT